MRGLRPVVAIDVMYLYNIIMKAPGRKYNALPAWQLKTEVGNSAQTV